MERPPADIRTALEKVRTPACVVNMWERLLLETTPARVEENGREQWDRWWSMKGFKREG